MKKTVMTGLIEGKFDIALAAIDNMVAYQEGQGEVKVEGEIDLVAIMGINNGFNSLMAGPQVKDIADFRGRKVAVDAATTGYAFVLYDILRRHGLNSGDYVVERAGGASRRWEALREGKQDGTLLSLPWDIIAEKNGFRRLATSSDVGRFQGSAGTVRRKWVAANEARVVGFIRGYVAGLDWISDPANRDAALALLRKNLKSLTPELADASYQVLLDPATGLQRKAELDIAGPAHRPCPAQRVRPAAEEAQRPGEILRPDVLPQSDGSLVPFQLDFPRVDSSPAWDNRYQRNGLY